MAVQSREWAVGRSGLFKPRSLGGALAVVRDAQAELGFELELVDIDGDPELEAHSREHLPVIEIDAGVHLLRRARRSLPSAPCALLEDGSLPA
jgi:hypothetical protein